MPGPDLGAEEGQAVAHLLSRLSARVVKCGPKALAFYQTITHDEWGVGIDAVPALDCWGFGLPGFQGLKLEKGSTARMGYTAAGYSRRRLADLPFPGRQRDHRAAAGARC